MKLDILAIGAHPDDIELTCSGTVIKLVGMGKQVGIADLTRGELGTRGDAATRMKEAARAAEILGVQVRENLGIPDGDIALKKENLLKVITLIRSCRPEVLMIPYHTDRHPDHEHAHSLCREAIFYAGLEKIETIAEGKKQKVHRPSRYFYYMQWEEFSPSFIVDVSAEWPKRIESVKAFSSQFHDPASNDPETILSSPTFFDFLETRAKHYGGKIGVSHGEPFLSPAPLAIINADSIF